MEEKSDCVFISIELNRHGSGNPFRVAPLSSTKRSKFQVFRKRKFILWVEDGGWLFFLLPMTCGDLWPFSIANVFAYFINHHSVCYVDVLKQSLGSGVRYDKIPRILKTSSIKYLQKTRRLSGKNDLENVLFAH